MYKFCYHPGIDALRSIIALKELGQVEAIILQRLDWDDDFQGTNCLWWAGVHQISIAHRLLGYAPEPEIASVSLHDGLITAASITLGKTIPVMITISSRHPVKKEISAAVLCDRGVALLPDAYAGTIFIKKDDHEDEQRSIVTEMQLLLELKDFLQYLQNGCRPRCGFDMAVSVSSTICKIRRIANILPTKQFAA